MHSAELSAHEFYDNPDTNLSSIASPRYTSVSVVSNLLPVHPIQHYYVDIHRTNHFLMTSTTEL